MSRMNCICFFFSSRRRHTRCLSDWSSDVCSSDLVEDGGDDAAVAMSGWSGVALVEAEAADVAVAPFVVCEAQAHAFGIVFAASETVVLLELDIASIVSAGRFSGSHWALILS